MNPTQLLRSIKAVFMVFLFLVLPDSARSQPGVWQSHGPDLSLSVTTVEPDPTDALQIFVGTRQTGLFQSANGGINWEQSAPPLTGGCVSVVTFHQGRIFVGSTNLELGCEENAGIYISEDGGLSWQVPQDLAEIDIIGIVGLGDRVIAAGDEGLYFSNDAGDTWQTPAGLSIVQVLSLYEYRGIVYAGTFSLGVYVSADSGQTWQRATADPGGVGQYATIFTGVDSMVFAGSSIDCCDFGGLLVSSDNGATFTSVSESLLSNPVYDILHHDGTLMAAAQSGVFLSPDSGQTWQQGGGAVVGQEIHTLGYDGSTLLAGGPGGVVYKSVDSGASWSAVDFPGTGSDISGFFTIDGTTFAGTDGAGLYISSNEGDTWFPRQLTASQKSNGLLINPIFILSYGEGIYRSVDGGLSWESANAPLNVVPVSTVVEHENILYAATDAGLWIGADGVRWTQAATPVDSLVLNDILFVGGVGIVAGPGIYTSVDGANWTSAGLPPVQILTLMHHGGGFYAGTASAGVLYSTTPQGPWQQATGLISNKVVRHLFVFSDILYAATQQNGPYRSDDGITWTAVGGPLADISVNDMTEYNGLLYAATGSTRGGRTQTGLWASADNGLTWSQVDLPDNNVDILSLLEINGFLYAGGSRAFLTGNGIRWNPLGLGLRTGRINQLARFDLPGEVRMYAASQNGVFLQRIDQSPPVAVSVAPVTETGFISSPQVTLTLEAEGADSVDVSEDPTFANSDWQLYATVLDKNLTPANGEKTIYARFKDVSWNLSETLETAVTLDTEPPSFAAHQPPATGMPDSMVVFSQAVTDPNLEEVALFYRRPGEPFSPNRRSVFEDDRATIDGLFVTTRGLDYRIVATDRAGLKDTLQNGALDFFSLPIQVAETALGGSPGLPGGTGGAAFRMISIPMQLAGGSTAQTALGDLGRHGADGEWLFWQYLGGYEWASGATTGLQTGAGYFLLLRNGRTLSNNTGGTTAETTAGVLGQIPGWQLRPGDWTLVGNPYNTRISPGQLKLKHLNKALNEADPAFQVWAYDGRAENNSWSNQNIALEPWGGLAIYSDATDTLVFAHAQDPFAPFGPGKGVKKTSMDFTNGADGWRVRVAAQGRDYSDRINYFGILATASDGLDAEDWLEPPRLPGGVAVAFHPEWERASVLAADIRSPSRADHQWQLQVSAEPGTAVKLTFDDLDAVPDDHDVLLLDRATKIVRDLRVRNEIVVRIPSGSDHKALSIVVAKDASEQVAAEGFDLVPTEFVLEQNFPNPFNPTTTIRYGLPVKGDVTIKIFDSLGAHVLTLIKGEPHPAGHYEVVADLSGLGSGIYFCQILVLGDERFGQVRKMLLIQ